MLTCFLQWLPWLLYQWHQRWPWPPSASWYPAPSCPSPLSSSPSSTGQLASTARPSHHNIPASSRESVLILTDKQALHCSSLWSGRFMHFQFIWVTSAQAQFLIINKCYLWSYLGQWQRYLGQTKQYFCANTEHSYFSGVVELFSSHHILIWSLNK